MFGLGFFFPHNIQKQKFHEKKNRADFFLQFRYVVFIQEAIKMVASSLQTQLNSPLLWVTFWQWQ